MIRFFRNHGLLVFCSLLLAIGAGISFFIVNRLKDRLVYGKIRKGTIVEAVYGIATVKASRVYQLKVGTASTLKTVYIKEGDRVKAHAPLLTLDTNQSFTAPFTGVISELNFKEGEAVFAQSPILTVTDIRNRYLLASLEQQGALKAKPGQSVSLSFESMRDKVFRGVVTSVYSNGDRFWVRIDSSDLPEQVLPGMTADASILVEEHHDVLLVPVNAIKVGKVRVKKGEFLPVAELNVRTGIIDGNNAQVISDNLREGDLVRIAKEK